MQQFLLALYELMIEMLVTREVRLSPKEVTEGTPREGECGRHYEIRYS